MSASENLIEAGVATAPQFRKPSYPPAEVASILSISMAVVYRLIAKGDLRAAKIGGALRVNRGELTRYIEEIGLEVEPGR